ncbi:hypothetical protein [Lacisediminihabitans changchengi]|uniref:Alpha/beta hydrolase n=1 Tax=Lacisediminihabitans changchengi TaxID=2787634 RepID=A0A934W496_9MICO|nr:hypothetical protein [Lacisediminihabitans changchengi]MBK4348721.1 hypothetical protein [Lacisediminihabitans changchengi]
MTNRSDDGGHPLIISGGGSIAVGTDELFAASRALRAVAVELASCLRELSAIDGLVTATRVPLAQGSVQAAEHGIRDAMVLASRAKDHAGLLYLAVDRSATAYGIAEEATERLSTEAAATLGYAFGFFLPGMALAALPGLLGIAGAALPAAVAFSQLPPDRRAELTTSLRGWLLERKGILSDPMFASFVRHSVTSVDDVGAGLFHAVPAVSGILGLLGITGVTGSSRTVVGAGRGLGMLAETPVRTDRVASIPLSTAPQGWDDRAARIPRENAQVRIDRYSVGGQPERFEVYVSGTRDFSLGGDTQPWDMTSNLNGIAFGDSGSVRAVEQAMADAGVTAETPVVLTGHSQGGLVAALVAGSGEYDVRGLYTLGAPAAGVAVPHSVPWVAIEHTGDIVPATSGEWTSSDPVLVRRDISGLPSATPDQFFPTHMLPAYRDTAVVLDGATESRVVEAAGHFSEFTEIATPVSSTTYQSVRTSPVGG